MTGTEEKFKRFKRDLRATAKLCKRAYRLSEENARLRKALEKYADSEHHFSVVDGKVWEVFDNGYGVDEQEFGTWARKALNEKGERMKDLLETLIALGMILAFLCVPFVIGLLFLPVAVLGTVGYCLCDLLKRKP